MEFKLRNEKGLHCRFCKAEHDSNCRAPRFIDLYEVYGAMLRGIVCENCKPHLEAYTTPLIKLYEEQLDNRYALIDRLQTQVQQLQYKLKKNWLKFLNISNPKKKTKSFEVTNIVTEEVLGEIKWCGGWRQYVFEDQEIMLAEGCLYELFQKIKALREERQKKNG